MRMVLAALLAALVAVPALAQAPPAAKAPAKAPEYDPKAEVTFTGIIEDIHESTMRGDHPGLHLMVRTETETIEVHACPVRFMKELDFVLAKGDEIKVIASRPAGAVVAVARDIRKGQTNLTLRDKTGAPVWTGR
jgi:hypothetical protein